MAPRKLQQQSQSALNGEAEKPAEKQVTLDDEEEDEVVLKKARQNPGDDEDKEDVDPAAIGLFDNQEPSGEYHLLTPAKLSSTQKNGPMANEKVFWKLARPKYGVTNFKCDNCRTENTRLENRFRIVSSTNGREKRLLYTESFCELCVKLNFDINDLLIKHSEATRGRRNFAWGGL